MGMPRDKTRPANPQSGTHRDKTRPARQNSAVLAYFRSAGRKISRFLRRHSKQGEFYPADHHSPATQRTLPGTKLSGHTACKAATGTKLSPHTACKATTGTKLSQHSKKHPNQPIRGEQGENYPGRDGNKRRRENFIPQTTTHQPRSAHSPVQNSPGTQRVRPQPVQNSPRTRRVRPQPVQNSPSTAKNTQISPFEASREKIIPVETETSDAGRILSRRPPHTSHAGHTHWDKTLPALPNGQTSHKIACNSLTAYICAHSKTLEFQ